MNKILNSPEFDIRRSQLLTPFGVGSLTNINNQSVMIGDSQYWDEVKPSIIHDIRLEKAMNAKGFIEPPVKSDNKSIKGIRFPEWYFSPDIKSRELKKITEWEAPLKKQNNFFKKEEFERKPYDFPKKEIQLVPVRIICVCKNGHAQDFPWLEWCHNEPYNNQMKDHHLELRNVGQSGSINDLQVKCKTCGKSHKLTGIFDEKKFSESLNKIGVTCEGRYVWKKEDHGRQCSERFNLKVLLKNANNFYFPNISSSVNIPFKENRLIEAIQKTDEFSVIFKQLSGSDDIQNKLADTPWIGNLIEEIAKELKTTKNDVTETIIEFFSNDESEKSVMEYRLPEFEVLTGNTDFDEDAGRFDIKIYEKKQIPDKTLSRLLSKITLVNQLEVVSALKSYSRIEPIDSELIKERQLEGEQTTSGITEVSLRRDDNYYVGLKSLGEGIFIELDPKEIEKWSVYNSANLIITRIADKKRTAKEYDLEYLDAKYYLLHTLSHLLIRELNLSSGYSSSSLKERLYYSSDKGKEMYGILIYTSSSDSEGTLGGLVKQGTPIKFCEILKTAIEKARWCSFDPICIESDSQGRDSLNAAACHACSLISETSCEKMNVFLDRAVLIGTIENPDIGFFSDLI